MVRMTRRTKNMEDSSDEEVTPMKKKRNANPLDSDSNAEEEYIPIQDPKVENKDVNEDKSPKRKNILRCADSSDEDNEVNIKTGGTPKAKRLDKLKEMKTKIRAKKKIVSDSSEEDDSSFDDPQPMPEDEEEDLPMWENEEEPPEVVDIKTDEENYSNVDDFIVDDDEIIVSKLKSESKKRPRRNTKRIRAVSESNSDEEDYSNPYLDSGENVQMEMKNILNMLSKNTDKDKQNAKKYKKEVGKYQFSVHSDSNKAALITNKDRFSRNMDSVKFDKGLKEDRNLDTHDSEYYEYVETSAYGESIRVFPHSRQTARYNTKCSLSGCGQRLKKGYDKVVGVTKFCSVNFQFMKKINNFGKEGYYYVCNEHLPMTGSDEEQYSSDSN